MRATELIAKIQALVAQHGDLNLVAILDEDDEEVISRDFHDALFLDHLNKIGIYCSLPTFKEDSND